MPSSPKPLFVVLEGIDRCGKNLQAECLAIKLDVAGVNTRRYSTPDYNGPSGEAVARYLTGAVFLSCDGHRSHHDAMALQSMLICNRYAVAAKIRVGLAAGTSAVCVRWWQSALLYGQGDGIDPIFVRNACSHLPEPDLHLLLDVDPDEVSKRLDRSSHYEDPVRQRTLAASYRALWSSQYGKNPRWVVVRGGGEASEVSNRIWQVILASRPDLAGTL